MENKLPKTDVQPAINEIENRMYDPIPVAFQNPVVNGFLFGVGLMVAAFVVTIGVSLLSRAMVFLLKGFIGV